MIEISLLDVASINLDEYADCNQFTIKHIGGTLTLDKLSFKDFQTDCKLRHEASRFQLREAAMLIEKETGERADAILAKLIKAARDLELFVYEGGKKARYLPVSIYGHSVEAYANDLDKWLGINEPRITWRFKLPNKSTNNKVYEKKDSNSIWWQAEYEILNMAKSAWVELNRSSNGKQISNRAVADKVALKIEFQEKAYKKNRSISGDTIRNTVLKGWKYSPD